jgi:hypothetical protein
MSERDDYDDQPTRRRGSPLMTLLLITTIAVAVVLGGYLGLVAIVRTLEVFPPK